MIQSILSLLANSNNKLEGTLCIGDNGELIFKPSTTSSASSNYNSKGNLLAWMIDTCDSRNKKGTFSGYLFAKKMLIRYFTKLAAEQIGMYQQTDFIYGENEYIPYDAITPSLLMKMEEWMLKEGKIKANGETCAMTPATARTYLSYIKAAYSLAEAKGEIDKSTNPFGRGKFILPRAGFRDISLTDEELKTFLAYTPEKSRNRVAGTKPKDGRKRQFFSEEKAKDFWMFSYLCNGMHFADILKLKQSNIEKGKFHIIKPRTIKKTNYSQICITIDPPIEYILNKWGSKSSDPNAFVFPVLRTPKPSKPISSMNIKEKREWERHVAEMYTYQTKSFTCQMNRYLRKIAIKAGLDPQKFTTCSAKHTFINDSFKVDISADKIMQMLARLSYGHYNKKNTVSANVADRFQIYLPWNKRSAV